MWPSMTARWMPAATNDSAPATSAPPTSRREERTGREACAMTAMTSASDRRRRELRTHAGQLGERQRPVERRAPRTGAHRVVVLDARSVGGLDPELMHHVVVLVDQVVAVDHVPAGLRAELGDDLHGLVLTD